MEKNMNTDKLWKFRRAIRRNRKLIARCISLVLALVLAAAASYLVIHTINRDKQRAAEENKEADDTKIELDKNKDYGTPGFNKVAESDRLILSADFTTGEIRVTDKESGKEWYSNPPDRKNDTMVAMRSRIESQFYVTFREPKQKAEVEQDNYNNSIKRGGMSHELIANGIKFTFAFDKANVYIPVQYVLVGDSFQAEIVTKEIQYVGDSAYAIEDISLLPMFGAGGTKDEGYMLIPDGSGTLINYNNNKQKYSTITINVYGDNPTIEKTVANAAIQEDVTLPIFGAKCNDSAFLGVILTGDTDSAITATTSKKIHSYNTVYPIANIMESTKVSAASSWYYSVTNIFQFTESLLGENNYAVRYFFLNGDDANYTGMANRYKEFLEEKNQLKKTELAGKKYLVLDLYGAINLDKYVFGIKMPVVTPLTTYNDVCTIVKELKAEGVDNLIINYIGALKGGMENKVYSVVKPEPKLGSAKEFRNMISYLEQEGVTLFLETNPVDIHGNGNGYDYNSDVVQSFFEKKSFQYRYKLDSLKSINTQKWRMLLPHFIPEIVTKFVESANSWNIGNIAVDRLGAIVYSDYADDREHTLPYETLVEWDKALTAAGKYGYVMVHTGNAYTSAHTDVVTDVADSGSYFDMTNYSVPFYQLVFQDSKIIAPEGINTTVDYDLALMRTFENGSNMKYNLIYANVATLVGTEYNTMVSYSYEYWKDIIVEQYHLMQETTKQFAGKKITHHENLTEDVTLTVYDKVGKIVVNYGDTEFVYGGIRIKPRSHLVIVQEGA